MSDPHRKSGSPPVAPKPLSALPSRLVNGETPRTSTKKRERDSLASSIESTYGRKAILNEETPSRSQDSTEIHKDRADGMGSPSAPMSDRPQSPYTLNPPIDFDGLSWPCKSLLHEVGSML